MESLEDKVAIVSGASSGIGEAIARALVILGVHVIGIARRKAKLDEVRKSLEGSKGFFYSVQCDLRKEQDILNVFAFADEKFDGIDILVNSAGVLYIEPILNGTTEHYREILEVNALAPIITIREGVKSILKRGNSGRIVNIISIAALEQLTTVPSASLYEVSKAAFHIATKKIRNEIREKKYRIKITGIYPGLVETELIEKGGGDPKAICKVPHLKPEHIAESVVFALQSPDNLELDVISPRPQYEH